MEYSQVFLDSSTNSDKYTSLLGCYVTLTDKCLPKDKAQHTRRFESSGEYLRVFWSFWRELPICPSATLCIH
jgi:hypothetical protein